MLFAYHNVVIIYKSISCVVGTGYIIFIFVDYYELKSPNVLRYSLDLKQEESKQ